MIKQVLCWLLVSPFLIHAQPAEITNICKMFAETTIKTMQRNNTLPPDCRIAVTAPFWNDGNGQDTLKTVLGIEIAKSLTHALSSEAQARKLKWQFVFPASQQGNLLYGEMQHTFVQPSGMDENSFFHRLLEQEAAQYYLSGEFRLDAITGDLALQRMAIRHDPYQLAQGKPIPPLNLALPNAMIAIGSIPTMACLNRVIRSIPAEYTSVKLLKGKNQIASFQLQEEYTKSYVTGTLKINVSHELIVELTQPGWVYLFAYEPDAPDCPWLQPLYIQPNSDSHPLQAGKHILPISYTLMPGSYGQVFLKLVILQESIPIPHSKRMWHGTPLDVLEPAEIAPWLSRLKAIPEQQIATQDMLFSVPCGR